MSRLCCDDPDLYARYQEGQLETDVCLKSSPTVDEGHPVLSGLLQTYSEPLGEIAKTAVSTSSGDVVLPPEDGSSRTLELFVGAIYGNSLKQACSTCDVPELSWFGHKYNIQAMEAALCAVVASYSSTMCLHTAVKLYETVPDGFLDLKDVLFDRVMHTEGSHEGHSFQIQPRHVNVWLKHLKELTGYAFAKNPDVWRGFDMLSALEGIHNHKVGFGF